MKKRKYAKIGSTASTVLVLWNDKPIEVGNWILAMEADIYDNLHWSYRRKKTCLSWKQFLVTKTKPILFVSR